MSADRINDGGPVHPVRVPIPGALHANGDPVPTELHTGASMRDWFAAMSVSIAASHYAEGHPRGWLGIAECAYAIADALLQARSPQSIERRGVDE